jgi:hypothetical protein
MPSLQANVSVHAVAWVNAKKGKLERQPGATLLLNLVVLEISVGIGGHPI